MRKMFTTALMCLNLVVNANHLNSILSVRSSDHSRVSVAVDRAYTSAPSFNVDVENLAPGNHWISIAKQNRQISQHPFIVFSGYVFIPEQSNVVAVISRNNHLRIMQIVSLTPDCENDDNEYTFENNYGYGYPNTCATTIISDYDFNALRSSIDSKSFESTKLEIAEQAVNNYNFSSNQVAQLMRLFTFEISKLELAKYAYTKTIDKNRYFIINDEFTFSNSITELNSFIQGKG